MLINFKQNKTEIINELINKIELYKEKIDRERKYKTIETYENEEHLYYPFITEKEKKNKKFHKYNFITLNDIKYNYIIVEAFCNWKLLNNSKEWFYDCNPNEDKIGFFNIIPSLLLKYKKIEKLTINFSYIKEIQNLPPNIIELNLSHNKIKKIENIPKKVKYLTLNNTLISKIENIPKNLIDLKLLNTNITTIQNLPSNLEYLELNWNKIKEIQNLDYLNNNLELILETNIINIKNISKKLI